MAASLEADVEGKSKKSTGGRHFSKEELRELFTLNLVSSRDKDSVSTQSIDPWFIQSSLTLLLYETHLVTPFASIKPSSQEANISTDQHPNPCYTLPNQLLCFMFHVCFAKTIIQ